MTFTHASLGACGGAIGAYPDMFLLSRSGGTLVVMGATVQLRDVEVADLGLFFEFEQEPEANRRARFTPRDREPFMAHWTDRVLGDPTVFVQTVTVAGETAGNIVAWWQDGRRFIGYWLGREYWGRGVATAALGLFLQCETTRPLWADPAAANVGSVKLLEKHGFRRTGTDRQGQEEHVVLVLGTPAGSVGGQPG